MIMFVIYLDLVLKMVLVVIVNVCEIIGFIEFIEFIEFHAGLLLLSVRGHATSFLPPSFIIQKNERSSLTTLAGQGLLRCHPCL